jgi:hypothetical protein
LIAPEDAVLNGAGHARPDGKAVLVDSVVVKTARAAVVIGLREPDAPATGAKGAETSGETAAVLSNGNGVNRHLRCRS